MTERAADTLAVEVVGKKSRLLRNLLGMLMGDQSVTPPENEILVKDRGTGEVVYREAIDEGPYVAERVQEINQDLEWLDVESFLEKYPTKGRPSA